MAEHVAAAESSRLAELREHTRQLAQDLTGSLRRVRVCAGDAVVEVEWQPVEATPAAPIPAVAPNTAVPTVEGQSTSDTGTDDSEEGVLVVHSPMVGTFYRAPNPDAAPFVEVGDSVRADQTFAVIEAMKLFNPITAEHTGRVVEVLVPDAEPVEFGQPLLRIALDTSDDPAAELVDVGSGRG